MRRNRWPDVIGMGGRMFRNTHRIAAADGAARGHCFSALDPLTRAQFFQHVIHGGQGQPGVGLLPILAMRVELFAKGAQVIALGIGEVGEGEGVEALGFCIHWVIPHP